MGCSHNLISMTPNPNVRITLQDLADYTKSNPSHDVLTTNNFAPGETYPDYPLRIDALTIIMCCEGNSKIVIDLSEYDIKKDTLVVLQPENYIQILSCSTDFHCKTVFCGRNVIEKVLPRLTSMLPMIMQHRMTPVQQLSEKEAEGLNSFYNFLRLKLEDEPSPFQEQKVLCMLQAALFEIMDIRIAHTNVMPQKHTRREEIMARFILSVCNHFHDERQVGFYAKELCITPKHLSSVVKEISGRTAGEWIDHYVVLEAKMLLGSTDLTIQEISSQLNFANQSFFGKYFKHHTGVSPSEFRSNNVISKPDNYTQVS